MGGMGGMSGTGGAGGASCAPPFADCDGDGSCETDTQGDAMNCGACAHNCLTGACNESACQPFPIVTNLVAPQAIAVFQDEVFWGTGNGEVAKAPTNGGAPFLLGNQNNGAVESIVATTMGVFYTDTTRVTAIKPTGGKMWDSIGDPGVNHVAVNDQFVAWTASGAGRIRSALTTGNNNKTIALGENGPTSVVLDGDIIRWSNAGGSEIREASALGGALKPIVTTEPGPDHLVADATQLYFVAGDTIFSAVPGGTPKKLGPSGSDVRAMVLDTKYLYWTLGQPGEVRRMPRDGSSAPETIAVGQNYPYGIAVDKQAIYWANAQGGTIMKLAK